MIGQASVKSQDISLPRIHNEDNNTDGVTVRAIEGPVSENEMTLNLYTVCKIVTWWVLSVPVSLLTSYLLTKTL